MFIFLYFLRIFISLLLVKSAKLQGFLFGECDRWNGPNNSLGCVGTRYGHSEWATCYMNAVGLPMYPPNYDYFGSCQNWGDYRYCWYPSKRVCSHSDKEKLPYYASIQLPMKCFTNLGKDCNFYAECLEKSRPCANTEHSYAIDYAEKYCKRYESDYEKFSLVGKKWVDSVRMCLQKAVYIYSQPYASNIECKLLKTYAFNSHVDCYLKPDQSDRSISWCNLKARDHYLVVKTVWQAAFYEFSSTTSSFIKILKGCSKTLKEYESDEKLKLFNFNFLLKKLNNLNVDMQNIKNLLVTKFNEFVKKIINPMEFFWVTFSDKYPVKLNNSTWSLDIEFWLIDSDEIYWNSTDDEVLNRQEKRTINDWSKLEAKKRELINSILSSNNEFNFETTFDSNEINFELSSVKTCVSKCEKESFNETYVIINYNDQTSIPADVKTTKKTLDGNENSSSKISANYYMFLFLSISVFKYFLL
jgi:hypothetical protein